MFLLILGFIILIGGLLFNKMVSSPENEEGKRKLNIFRVGLLGAGGVMISVGLFTGLLYMQEPRYNTFVRDITGSTYANFTTGWHLKTFGTVTKIKKEMSVAFKVPSSEDEENLVSFLVKPKGVVFLDNVSADISVAVRVTMPQSEKGFRALIGKFGTPENAIVSLMIPSIERTIDNTTALMTAETYFSGGKTTFMNEFAQQMRHGLYVIDLKEVESKEVREQPSTQNATLENSQKNYGDKKKITYVATKRLDDKGIPVLIKQDFDAYGITIAAAIITNVKPNNAFMTRMSDKQRASADLAVAKEETKKEDAKRILAVSRGERMAAEAQATELLNQVTQTTKAETSKQLALTAASKDFESAQIQKKTAIEILDRDRIRAKSIKVLADANAYEKKVVIQANGALELKLEAYKYSIDRMAKAIENRKVPASLIMMGGSGEAGAGNDLAGSSTSINALLQIIAADSAKKLSLDMSMKKGNISGR